MFKAASGVILFSILFCGQAAAAQSGPLQNTKEAVRDCDADAPLPPPVGDRPKIEINLKTTEMLFAQRNKIPVDLHGQTVREVSVSWDSLWGVLEPVYPVVLQHGEK